MKNKGNLHITGNDSPVMADLARTIKDLGYTVTGSSEAAPSEQHITSALNAVIVAPTVPPGNPELKQAKSLSLPILSYADLVMSLAEDKQRMVVGGSGGRPVIAGLIVHVLKFHNRRFDFVLGKGTKSSGGLVHLSNSPLLVVDGQSVPGSCFDPIPVFRKFNHHIAIISDIDWQPSEEYPNKESYIREFDLFQSATPKGGVLIYSELDPVVKSLCQAERSDIQLVPYKAHDSVRKGDIEYLLTPEKDQIPLQISGLHMLRNISAAKEALKKVGVTSDMFYQAISTFVG